MTEEELYQKLIEAGIRFVSFRPRSEKEIKDFLLKKLTKRKVVAPEVIEKVINRLKELNYLDDRKFITWWIEQRQTFKPKGKQLIYRELLAKGITKDSINELFESNKDTDSELELARKAAAKKVQLWQKLPIPERKKKLYSFLGRRGFSGETIRRLIDEIYQKDYNND